MLAVELKVNGKIFTGWENISVIRTIRAVSGAFRLQFTDAWEPAGGKWYIQPGDECQVVLSSQTMITGFVDLLETSLSGETRQISVVGRDKTADLVDCFYDFEGFQFSKVSFDNLARSVAKKFGVGFQNDNPVNTIPKGNEGYNPGDTVFSTLERQARKFGRLLTTDGKGNLVITKVGTELITASLVQGVNIEAISVKYDHSNRFSSYKVLGQKPVIDDHVAGKSYHGVFGTARDQGITRNRPLVMQGEGKMTSEEAVKRAQWEAKTRAARSQQIIVTVPSWTQGDVNGVKSTELWPVNKLIRVKAPSAAVDAELLIAEIEFSYTDNGGEQATMTLTRPDAFIPEPIVKKIKDPEDDLDDGEDSSD